MSDHADGRGFELHSETINLARYPFPLAIGEPPTDLLSIGRK
jgi:hypothetical protein